MTGPMRSRQRWWSAASRPGAWCRRAWARPARRQQRHADGRALNRRVELVREEPKPNILFIMGDDIGYMQPSIYHRGLMVGETPNIDRIGHEGAMFTDYYAEQSCTAGRNAFFTGMHPLRTGMIPPQLPGSPCYLRPGTPAIAKFLHDLGYSTGEFGKNHLGDHTDALPTAHGFQEFWGYLYHLDAMQGVSFPDINKSPTEQTVSPPARTRRSRACPRCRARSTRRPRPASRRRGR